MKLKTRKPLGLEALEDRWVPATVHFDGSNLTVSNLGIAAGKSKIQVIETATAGNYQVLDGTAAVNNGTYAVTGNITIMGNNAQDTAVVNVKTTLAGNLSVTTGNGPSTVTVDGTAKTSSITGNTRISTGLGTATVNVGTTNGLANRGSLTASSRSPGSSVIQIGGGLTASTSVGGLLSISDFPFAILGSGAGTPAAAVLAGGVNINNTGNSQLSSIVLSTLTQDLGNLTVQGGQGDTSVALEGNQASVLGTAALNLGNGKENEVALSDGGTVGSLIYNGGNGANLLQSAVGGANVLGNVMLNWGNGANALETFAGAAVTVQGNMSINNGNGGLDGTTRPFLGVVNGNLSVNTGNGSNSFTLDGANGANVGGNFNYTGGNGGNSVTVTAKTGDLFNLNTRFGNGSANAFTIGTGPGAGYVNGSLTGSVAWGVPTSAVATVGPTQNGFFDNGYVWQNNITLTNIPS